MPIRVEVEGNWAGFFRPELKTERATYDMITPSAARGLLEAIYWHPGMRYVIDRITVMNPIVYDNIRRNEVGAVASAENMRAAISKGKPASVIYTANAIQQRSALVLRNVHYVIDAHFEMTNKAHDSDSPAKFISMFNRRLEKGQCFHNPYFGCREFPAVFKPWASDEEPQGFEQGTRDLGFMLYDMNYSNPKDIKPMFFRAMLENGVLDLANVKVMS